MSFSPLEGLGNYKNGDLLSAMVNAKEAITFRRSNNNDLKSEAKRLEIQTIPNKVIKINWEFS